MYLVYTPRADSRSFCLSLYFCAGATLYTRMYNMHPHTHTHKRLPMRRTFLFGRHVCLEKISKCLARGETKTENKSFFFVTSQPSIKHAEPTDMTSAIYEAVTSSLWSSEILRARVLGCNRRLSNIFFTSNRATITEPRSALTEAFIAIICGRRPTVVSFVSSRKIPYKLIQYYRGVVFVFTCSNILCRFDNNNYFFTSLFGPEFVFRTLFYVCIVDVDWSSGMMLLFHEIRTKFYNLRCCKIISNIYGTTYHYDV